MLHPTVSKLVSRAGRSWAPTSPQAPKSRSQAYREALAEYVVRRDGRSITSALDDVPDAVGRQMEPWPDEAGRRAVERSELVIGRPIARVTSTTT